MMNALTPTGQPVMAKKLLDLNDDVLQAIIDAIHPADVVNFSLANKVVHALASTRLKKHRALQKEFGIVCCHKDCANISRCVHGGISIEVLARKLENNPESFDPLSREIKRSRGDTKSAKDLKVNHVLMILQSEGNYPPPLHFHDKGFGRSTSGFTEYQSVYGLVELEMASKMREEHKFQEQHALRHDQLTYCFQQPKFPIRHYMNDRGSGHQTVVLTNGDRVFRDFCWTMLLPRPPLGFRTVGFWAKTKEDFSLVEPLPVLAAKTIQTRQAFKSLIFAGSLADSADVHKFCHEVKGYLEGHMRNGAKRQVRLEDNKELSEYRMQWD